MTPVRLRFTVEYDGTDFAGWQAQSSGRTVQGEIERCLAVLLGRQCRVTGSGRTDAGVHASGQVAQVDIEEAEEGRVVSGLPEILPSDVAVNGIQRAGPGFHARFSATGREYSYLVLKGRSPLTARYAYECPWPCLDTAAMMAAAGLSLGGSDWRGMSKEGSGNRTWRADVRTADVTEDARGWTLTIRADRFLRGMVRIWAGTLVEIGRGRFAAGRMREILDTGDRSLAGPSLPAKGLTLVRVEYGMEEG
jgi:tRNA pseudouridine38-40 synthase